VLSDITDSPRRLSLSNEVPSLDKLGFAVWRGCAFFPLSFGNFTWVIYDREKFSRFLISTATFLFVEVVGEFCSRQLLSVYSGFKFDF